MDLRQRHDENYNYCGDCHPTIKTKTKKKLLNIKTFHHLRKIFFFILFTHFVKFAGTKLYRG